MDMCVRRVRGVRVRKLAIRGHGERLGTGRFRRLSKLHGRGGVCEEKVGREKQGEETAGGQQEQKPTQVATESHRHRHLRLGRCCV